MRSTQCFVSTARGAWFAAILPGANANCALIYLYHTILVANYYPPLIISSILVPPLPINSPNETQRAVDTLNALTSSFPPFPPLPSDDQNSNHEMDFSTDAPGKVGDDSPNATNNNNTNKSTASGESALPKRKRIADNSESSSSIDSNSLPKAKKSISINSLSEALLANRCDLLSSTF